MEITEDQKSYVLFQLSSFPESSRITMERMFSNHLLPFIQRHELDQLQEIVEQYDEGNEDELRQFAVDFLLADSVARFPEHPEIDLLSRIRPEHVDVGSKFAGILLAWVTQALVTDQLTSEIAKNKAADLDSELEQFFEEESKGE